MNKHVSSLLFALAIVIGSSVLGYAYLNRNKSQGSISVTGLGKTDFVSDLIVWEGQFTRSGVDQKKAYADLESDKEKISAYLTSKGIDSNTLVFSAVESIRNSKTIYSDNGRYLGEEFTGYTLYQEIQIESKEVEKVETISREITELLNQGVNFNSRAPRYYYTQIEDLKIEMISRATENARLRAEKIAVNSGANLGELSTAKMGIFQITGQNSNEDYSWGGVYNTSSKNKTASITMKLTYVVE